MFFIYFRVFKFKRFFYTLKIICVLYAWYWNNRHFSSFIPYSMSLVERNGASSGTAYVEDQKEEEQIAQLSSSYGGRERARGTSEGLASEGAKKDRLAKWGDAIFSLDATYLFPLIFFPRVISRYIPPYCWKLYPCPPVRRRCSSSFILDFSIFMAFGIPIRDTTSKIRDRGGYKSVRRFRNETRECVKLFRKYIKRYTPKIL